MSYAAIMVHFDAGPSAYRRLHLAVDLANRFQAALIGISGKSYLPTFVPDGLTAGEGAGSEGARSLAQLARRIRRIQRYDGVRLRAGGRATRAYRDPLLRISGRTSKVVRVRR